MNKKFIAALAFILMIILTAALFACNRPPASMIDEVSLDKQQAALAVGDEFTITPTVNPLDAPDTSVAWTSSDTEVVTVDDNGKCTAVSAGEATVTVTTTDGAKTAACEVYVGDILVKAEETAATANEEETGDEESETPEIYCGGEEGTTLFTTIAAGLTAATDNKTVIIVKGDYGEAVTATKSVKIIGVGTVSLKSFGCSADNAEIVLKNLMFKDTAYPAGGSASVVIPENASAEISECAFSIESTEELAGGYAILVGKQAESVTISDCTISNYRYGIYVNPTDQEVNITDNSLSNLEIGIGVDIRQENSDPPANYPTRGRVGANEYNEVETNTQFFHYGESYDGDFDFSDFDDQSEIDDGLDVTD